MSIGFSEQKTPEKGREGIPAWMRRGNSRKEIAQAIESPEVLAAFYTPSPSPDKAVAERILKSGLILQLKSEWLLDKKRKSIIEEKLRECGDDFKKHYAESFSDAVTANSLLLESIQQELEAVTWDFPDYDITQFDIYTLYPGQAGPWHTDNGYEKDLFLIKTLYGPSTEYTDQWNYTGSQNETDIPVTRPPYESTSVHKGGEQMRGFVASHRTPEVKGMGRIFIVIHLTKKKA